jgi:hypothetical protein
MVSPGFFEPVRQLLHRLHTLWSPHQKSRHRRTGPTNHPDKTFHSSDSPSRLCTPFIGAWMHREPRTFPFIGPFGHEQPLRHIADSRYTSRMDRVRFGRAIGTGARAAARSMLSAAEAAAAPNPSAPTATSRQTSQTTGRTPAGRVQIPDPQVVKSQVQNLKRSVWSPFAKFSSVLWLEVTGVFFLIFALITGQQVWKWHAAVRLPPSAPAAQRLYLCTFLFALFGYFTVSSFVRARRREKAGR